MQTTSSILMVRPLNFSFNEQTAESNAFQNPGEPQEHVQEKAQKEFDRLAALLKENGVEVLITEDTPVPHTPDSVFPNNWISTHTDGTIYLYPMQAENRRHERRKDILDKLEEHFIINKITNLSYFENQEKFLEGTGSMVLDRNHKIAYACLSPRTNVQALKKFCELSGYQSIYFHAFDKSGKAIYHTNVMMALGERFALICLDVIKEMAEKEKVVQSLLATGKEIIPISREQMENFAGNILELKNKNDGENLLVMSDRAFNALSSPQLTLLKTYCRIIHSDLETIENNGGGSARCMIAEIHLQHK